MQYFVSVIADGTELATPGEMAAIDVFNDRLRAQGYWVYANGLAEPSTATVIGGRGEEPVLTDGPFVESKEFLAGFWIIEVPNLDVALKLAAEGSKAWMQAIVAGEQSPPDLARDLSRALSTEVICGQLYEVTGDVGWASFTNGESGERF